VDTPECGNPVDISGCKIEKYVLGVDSKSRYKAPVLGYSGYTFDAGGVSLKDNSWFLEPIDRRLTLDPLLGEGSIVAVRSGKESVKFLSANAGIWTSVDREYRLTKNGTEFILYDPKNSVVETYTSLGVLKVIYSLSGGSSTKSAGVGYYDFTNDSGRRTRYVLSATGDRITQVQLNSGAVYRFDLGTGNLSDKMVVLTQADLTTKLFSYALSPTFIASLSQGSNPGGALIEVSPPTGGVSASSASVGADFWLGGYSLKPLTGVVDESGTALSTFGVLDNGKTISTERSGGVGKFQFNYTGGTTVAEPLGATIVFGFQDRNLDRSLLSSVDRSDVNGTVIDRTTYAYAGDGLLSSSTRSYQNQSLTFTTAITCFNFDATRNIELQRLEGRDGAIGCASLVPTAGTTERLISKQWHPDWLLVTRLAEPKKLTTLVYQGQPDPTAANAIANCLSSLATLLPGGKPLAVVCKRVEQATTDETGTLGFSAVASGTPRIWSYIYAADGQMLVENGPRTDVTDTTTYTYYAATDTALPAKWYKGDVQTIVNAAGHTTTFNEYELNGKPKKITDPNGTVIQMTYHIRDWLTGLSTTTAGITQSTAYEYWPTGKLKKVTQPDGSYLSYGYDAAQRLTSVTDNLNNQVLYTLDNADNRTKEEFKDSGGVLRRNISRAFSTLNRLQSVTGALQ
jgi:YD repeat-containing protein